MKNKAKEWQNKSLLPNVAPNKEIRNELKTIQNSQKILNHMV